MTECSTGGCQQGQVISWPLLGNTGLCSKHYDHPTPQFAGLVAESKEPPDDFDIPEWGGPLGEWDGPLGDGDKPLVPTLPRYLTAAKDTWVTKEGRAIRIPQLEDSHLHNIQRMLQRIKAGFSEVDEETGDPVGGDPPPDVMELFDRKLSAIEAEIERRQPSG